MLTELLENRFKIGNVRFGFDAIIGLVPIAGDIAAAGLSLYIVWIGKKAKLPQTKIDEMIKNIFVDLILGMLPLVGDIADIFYRANTRNLRILKNYLKNPQSPIIEGQVI